MPSPFPMPVYLLPPTDISYAHVGPTPMNTPCKTPGPATFFGDLKNPTFARNKEAGVRDPVQRVENFALSHEYQT